MRPWAEPPVPGPPVLAQVRQEGWVRGRTPRQAACLGLVSRAGRGGLGRAAQAQGPGLGWVGWGGGSRRQAAEEPTQTPPPPPSRAHSPPYVQTQLATGFCEREDCKLRKPASALVQAPGSKEHGVLGQEARGERLEGPRGRVLCAQASHCRHTGLVVTRLQGKDEERRWLHPQCNYFLYP